MSIFHRKLLISCVRDYLQPDSKPLEVFARRTVVDWNGRVVEEELPAYTIMQDVSTATSHECVIEALDWSIRKIRHKLGL